MPPHPSQRNKFNYIKDFIFDPCDAPVTLYVEAFFEAFLRAAISYYALDLVQMFTSWVRPSGALKDVRGGGHGSRSRRKGKPKTWLKFWRKFTGFDPSDWGGKNLPYQKEMEGRQIPGGAKYLWFAFDVQQRIVYWIFVYELVERAFYEAFLTVNNSVYCREQRRPMLFATREYQGNIPLLGRTPLTIEKIEKRRDITYADGNYIRVGTESSSVSVSWSDIEMWDGEPPDGSEGVILVADNGAVYSPDDMKGGGQSGVAASPPNGMGVRVYMVGNRSFWVNNVVFNAFGTDVEPDPDPPDWRGLLGPLQRL